MPARLCAGRRGARARVAPAPLLGARDDGGAVLPDRRSRCLRSPARSRPRRFATGDRFVADRAAVLTRVRRSCSSAVFAAAILVDALFARDRVAAARVLAGLVVARRRRQLRSPHSRALRRVCRDASAARIHSAPRRRLTLDHSRYLALSTALAPFAALVLLLVEARGAANATRRRALIAVTICASSSSTSRSVSSPPATRRTCSAATSRCCRRCSSWSSRSGSIAAPPRPRPRCLLRRSVDARAAPAGAVEPPHRHQRAARHASASSSSTTWARATRHGRSPRSRWRSWPRSSRCAVAASRSSPCSCSRS